RHPLVTGVQTCALPIFSSLRSLVIVIATLVPPPGATPANVTFLPCTCDHRSREKRDCKGEKSATEGTEGIEEDTEEEAEGKRKQIGRASCRRGEKRRG